MFKMQALGNLYLKAVRRDILLSAQSRMARSTSSAAALACCNSFVERTKLMATRFRTPSALANSKCGSLRIRSEGRGTSTDTTSTSTPIEQRSEADKLVDGMSFIQLCDEFQCVSSPAVEATCRQLARDILEIRDGNRALATLAYFVKYKDPLRSFKGREKYKRPCWAKSALENPTVAVRQMEMMSTSLLKVQWTIRGRPKSPASLLTGDVVLNIISTFTLNQISGQVLEHQEEWDLSGSSPLAQAYFWISRLIYSTVEGGKDASETAQGISKILDKNLNDEDNIYVDPTDPRKYFQVDDRKDIYQAGLFIALLYLLVQFLKLTL